MVEIHHFGDQIEIHGVIRDPDQISAYDLIVSRIDEMSDPIDVIGYALLDCAHTIEALAEGQT